jgi:gamma-tubulin complex component 4
MAALLNPFKVLADVIPLAGRIVGAGAGFVAFLVSAVGSITVIALAWLWYRPLLGSTLLVVACGGIYLLNKAMKPKAV